MWVSIWPIIAFSLILISIILLDVLPYLPSFVHWAALFSLGGFWFWLFIRLISKNYKSNFFELGRRLCQENKINHRPFDIAMDKNIFRDVNLNSDFLWAEHKTRVTKQINKLNFFWPTSTLSKIDPFVIRIALILFVVISFGFGGADFSVNLSRAFDPTFSLGTSTNSKIKVWIRPPVYSFQKERSYEYLQKRKPNDKGFIYLRETNNERPQNFFLNKSISLLVGSKLMIQVTGGKERPWLRLGNRRLDLLPVNGENHRDGFRLEYKIKDSDHNISKLEIMADNRQLVNWPINILIDQRPLVELVEAPKQLGHGKFNLKFEVQDDFGIEEVWAEVKLIPLAKMKGKDDSIRLKGFPLGLGKKIVKVNSQHDYSSHPWAGGTVKLWLFAKDNNKRIGGSDPFQMILPERVFNHPVASALAMVRRKLNSPNKENVKSAIDTLSKLNTRPEHYFHNKTVFLNIAISRIKLTNFADDIAIKAVQRMLWNTMLLIEDGEFAITSQELIDAWTEVNQSLAQSKNIANLERVLSKLKETLNNYLNALSLHLQKKPIERIDIKPFSLMIESKKFQSFLDRIQALAKMGQLETVERMLSQLKRELSDLQNNVRSARSNPWARAMREALNSIAKITKDQQKLYDKNMRNANERRSRGMLIEKEGLINQDLIRKGENSGSGYKKMHPATRNPKQTPHKKTFFLREANAQNDLQVSLGNVSRKIESFTGIKGDAFEKAINFMESARKNFENNLQSNAAVNQAKSLEQLHEGRGLIIKNINRRSKGISGNSSQLHSIGKKKTANFDPFGRLHEGVAMRGSYGGEVKIPTDSEFNMTREIFDELNRRSRQQIRPKLELEFINRLLKRF